MPYFVVETLRKWPPIPFIDRKSVKTYSIQPTKSTEKLLVLEPNSSIWFPIIGIHRDPEIYPNPDKFEPELFNDENRHNINPYAYIPFGSGPRNCIGKFFMFKQQI